MKYKVITPFFDKTDNLKAYSIGDSYEHKDADRVAYLSEKGFLESKSKQPPKEEKEVKKTPSKKKSKK